MKEKKKKKKIEGRSTQAQVRSQLDSLITDSSRLGVREFKDAEGGAGTQLRPKNMCHRTKEDKWAVKRGIMGMEGHGHTAARHR
jgi:hypothetical protein